MSQPKHIVAAARGRRVVVAQHERHVAIWDLDPHRLVAEFETDLDYGGNRITLPGDGRIVVAAAHSRYGLSAFDATTGRRLWTRKDLKHTQNLRSSWHAEQCYALRHYGSGAVVSLADGATLGPLRGVRDVVESPFAPIAFLQKARPEVVAVPSFERLARIELRTSGYGVASVAFSPDAVVVGEGGGPICCWEADSGEERWAVDPGPNGQCIKLSYLPSVDAFFGVLMPHLPDRPLTLIRMAASDGRSTSIATLGKPAECGFCLEGAALLTSTGSLVRLPSGIKEGLRLTATGTH